MAGGPDTGATHGRVGSTGPVLVYFVLLWMVGPLGWPVVAAFLIADDAAVAKALAVMVALGLVALAAVWLLVAFLARHARPLPDGSGLTVRSFFRTYEVPWDRVLAVQSTEFEGAGRYFGFSKTIVGFEADGVRMVTVRMSFRSGSSGAFEIRSWSPPGHPVRAEQAEVVPESLGLVPSEPSGPPVELPDSLGPDRVYRIVTTGVGCVATAILAVSIVRALLEGAPSAIGLVLVALLAAFAVRSAKRAWNATVELQPTQLVSRGTFRTRVFAASEIVGFEVARGGIGSMARVVLLGRGSRLLAVGTGYGGYAEQVVSTLRTWLAESRRSRPSADIRASSPP